MLMLKLKFHRIILRSEVALVEARADALPSPSPSPPPPAVTTPQRGRPKRQAAASRPGAKALTGCHRPLPLPTTRRHGPAALDSHAATPRTRLPVPCRPTGGQISRGGGSAPSPRYHSDTWLVRHGGARQTWRNSGTETLCPT